MIVGIASNPENFSFLHYCQPNPDIVIGDARLTMAKQADGSFDLIIVDAFSSDAVPVHLMTAEALRMYAAQADARPASCVLHISNRYLDLDSVLGATLPLVPELHGMLMSDDTADGSYARRPRPSPSSRSRPRRSSRSAPRRRRTNSTARPVKPWTDDTPTSSGRSCRS